MTAQEAANLQRNTLRIALERLLRELESADDEWVAGHIRLIFGPIPPRRKLKIRTLDRAEDDE